MAKEIEEGSRVQILDMDECLMRDGDFEIGQICYVKTITKEDESYSVWTLDGSDYWFFGPLQIKLVGSDA